MSSRTTTIVIAVCFFLTLIELVAMLMATEWAFFYAIGIGLLGLALFHFFLIEFDSWWLPSVLVSTSCAVGTLISYKSNREITLSVLWLSPIIAGVTAGVVIIAQRRASRHCDLCDHRLRGGISFSCPRCSLLICDRDDCWDFHHCRCRLCLENRVPIFSPNGRWWDKQFGARLQHGRCQLCQGNAEDLDLRGCGNCGYLQCKECWDFTNGECGRCHWTVADLPEPLKIYMLPKQLAN